MNIGNVQFEKIVAGLIGMAAIVLILTVAERAGLLSNYDYRFLGLLITGDPVSTITQSIQSMCITMLCLIIAQVVLIRKSFSAVAYRYINRASLVTLLLCIASALPLRWALDRWAIAIPLWITFLVVYIRSVFYHHQNGTSTKDEMGFAIAFNYGLALMFAVMASYATGAYRSSLHLKQGWFQNRMNVYAENRTLINADVLFSSSQGVLVMVGTEVEFVPMDKIERITSVRQELPMVWFAQ